MIVLAVFSGALTTLGVLYFLAWLAKRQMRKWAEEKQQRGKGPVGPPSVPAADPSSLMPSNEVLLSVLSEAAAEVAATNGYHDRHREDCRCELCQFFLDGTKVEGFMTFVRCQVEMGRKMDDVSGLLRTNAMSFYFGVKCGRRAASAQSLQEMMK